MRARGWLVGWLVAILSILPFAGSLGSAFVYDDHRLIEGEPAIHSLAHLADLWRTELWHRVGTLHFHYWRPLVTTTYALDWVAWDGNPTGFHATNLALHAITTWLVLRALRRWTGHELSSIAGALLWAWHPSKAESVAWVSGRTDLLCTLGMLVAAEGAARRLRSDRRGWGLEALGALVAYTSKEAAVVLPGIVAVEAWAAAGRPALDRAAVRRMLAGAWPDLAVAVAYLGVRWAVYPIVPRVANGMPARDSLLYAFETFGEILRVIAWPLPMTLERAPIRTDDVGHLLHHPPLFALGAVALLVLVGAIAFTRRRRPAVAIGLVMTAFTLAPVANVLPVRTAYLFAERFAYAPLIGVALVVAALLPERARRGAWGALALVAVGSAAASARHTSHLANDARLWTYERGVHPDLPMAVRWSCLDALMTKRTREALDLAALGYRASRTWFIPQPFRVDFSLQAARAYEEMTRDRDRATLARIAEFYRRWSSETGVAELATPAGTFEIDPRSPEAKWYRDGEPEEYAIAAAFGARALARTGDCASAVRLVRATDGRRYDPTARVTATLVLARCGDWDGALAAAARLPPGRPRAELTANLAFSREATERAPRSGGVDGALLRSRVGTLLGDRAAAYDAVVPFRDDLLADPQGTLYFARAAWAAGDDEAARGALATRMDPAHADRQLETWSRELGRGD